MKSGGFHRATGQLQYGQIKMVNMVKSTWSNAPSLMACPFLVDGF